MGEENQVTCWEDRGGAEGRGKGTGPAEPPQEPALDVRPGSHRDLEGESCRFMRQSWWFISWQQGTHAVHGGAVAVKAPPRTRSGPNCSPCHLQNGRSQRTGREGPAGPTPRPSPALGCPTDAPGDPAPTCALTWTPNGHGVGGAALPGPPPPAPRRGCKRQRVPVWLWALWPLLLQPCRGCSARGCPALAKREGGSSGPPQSVGRTGAPDALTWDGLRPADHCGPTRPVHAPTPRI